MAINMKEKLGALLRGPNFTYKFISIKGQRVPSFSRDPFNLMTFRNKHCGNKDNNEAHKISCFSV